MKSKHENFVRVTNCITKNNQLPGQIPIISITHLDTGQELAEPLILLTDLEGQFPSVANHQHRYLGNKNVKYK